MEEKGDTMFENRTLNRLNQMLDEANSGTFQESDYNETKLSKLESKWKQFLNTSSLSKQNLEQEKENIKALVTDISHQTKTPMTNIKMYAELLTENLTLGNTETNQELLAEIIHQTEKLEFLIQSLTKISRLESNIVEVVPSTNSVNQLISDVVCDFEHKAKKKQITLSVLFAEPVTATFDYKWTKEALSNIMDNAIKYSTPDSTVALSIMEYPIYTAISVKDNGIGISEEEIPKIFERFYRSTDVQQEDGVGIGLYLARTILRKENGYIKVTSTPGKGSTFFLYLLKKW